MIHNLWHRGHTSAAALELPVFFTRLAQTIAWCDAHADPSNPASSLRTIDKAPPQLPVDRDESVCFVGSSRQNQFSLKIVKEFPDLLGGRLLVYFPDADLCDGAAEAETDGFFNAYNIPPWDTWVSYFCDAPDEPHCYDNYLVAFIPRSMVQLADSGILVNPEECIAWMENTQTELVSRLPGAAFVDERRR